MTPIVVLERMKEPYSRGRQSANFSNETAASKSTTGETSYTAIVQSGRLLSTSIDNSNSSGVSTTFKNVNPINNALHSLPTLRLKQIERNSCQSDHSRPLRNTETSRHVISGLKPTKYQRRFPCSYCQMVFTRRCHVRRHISNVHEKKKEKKEKRSVRKLSVGKQRKFTKHPRRFPCNYCYMLFTRSSHVK